MTGDSDPAVLQPPLPPIPSVDPLFDFTVDDWLEPPAYVTTLPETSSESNIRALAEQEYRKSTTPTAWHSYVTLGRYVVDGFTFDSIIGEGLTDPLKMYCVIWYQYGYHIDNKIDIPPKLQSWVSQKAQPFLTKHAVSALSLDTKTTTWKDFSRSQSLSNPWSEVASKQKKPKKAALPKSYTTAASILGSSHKPITITEEDSKTSISTETRGQKRPANRDDNSAASDGKQSVLLPESNVPVCDGTHRVTLRWKTSVDITRLSRQTNDLKEEIYNLLNDIFDDDDGLLYKWQQVDTSHHNSISNMTPTEVRQFISPSVGILPSQSMIVIPIRFGFSSNTPAKWRNLKSTQEKLEKHKVTVSFSNCTSTSGNLVVAGYILLKAPMTTHRLRYLQSLRQQLPPATPLFDILLHKRTPSDQQIPHLAVQCGHKHVHSLCEMLAKILTGDGSALYIPRFAFSQMTDKEADTLFHTHDVHVKSLRWLPLFPLLSNLDKPRKEYQPDGSVIERTTREWARTIKNLEGNGLAQCDVVNGGLDQLCYLLFTPQHTEAANIALEDYRKRLYPFSQREAQFRERVGPPPFIHLSKSVIANLDFLKRLSASNTSDNNSTNASASNEESSAATPKSGMTDSTTRQASRPPTPAESLRQQYSNRTHHSHTTDSDDDSTAVSTATAPSKLSDGRMSTSSAKLRELDAVIQRQKKTNDKKDAKNSERISLIERQLHRLDDLDNKLDDVKADFGTRLNLFEARMVDTVQHQIDSSSENIDNMNTNLMQLMSIVNKLVIQGRKKEARSMSDDAASRSVNSNSSSSRSSMSAESPVQIQSPEHKRHRSATKSSKPSVRRALESELQAASHSSSVTVDKQESFDSLDLAMQQVAEIVNADMRTSGDTSHTNEQPDSESQYTAGSQTQEEQNKNATPSPDRESTS